MLKKITIIILLSTVLLSATFFMTAKSDKNTTTVEVDPSTTTISGSGETFSINVTIINVTGLCAWQCKLYYHNTVLNCSDATEGPFLQTGGPTMWAENLTDAYNSTHGRAFVGSTLLGQTGAANGSGVLTILTFQITGSGDTVLHIETELYDCGMPPTKIEHDTVDGTVHVQIHDVAVTNCCVCCGATHLHRNVTACINVTVANEGGFTETFDVTVYWNSTHEIETKSVTLASGANTTIQFHWDTTSCQEYANYTISAYAHPVPSETDLADNNFTYGDVEMVHVGDVNGDKKVRVDDVLAVALIFGSNCGDPRYDPNCDMNCDGKIRVDDVLATANQFGWGPP